MATLAALILSLFLVACDNANSTDNQMLQPIQYDLTNGLQGQRFTVVGNSFYVDTSTNGAVSLQVDSLSAAPLSLQAGMTVNLPTDYKELFLTALPQPGKVFNAFSGENFSITQIQQNVTATITGTPNVNVTNPSVPVNATAPIDVSGSTVSVPGGVAVTNTPGVNIGNTGTVAIGNTPNVGVPGGVAVTNVPGVTVNNSPNVGVPGGVAVTNNPNVGVIPNQNIATEPHQLVTTYINTTTYLAPGNASTVIVTSAANINGLKLFDALLYADVQGAAGVAGVASSVLALVPAVGAHIPLSIASVFENTGITVYDSTEVEPFIIPAGYGLAWDNLAAGGGGALAAHVNVLFNYQLL